MGCFNGSSINDILSADISAPSKLKVVWQAVVWSALYLIWKARNATIFQLKHMVADDIFFEIKLMSFFWIFHRSKKININWVDWCKGSAFSS